MPEGQIRKQGRSGPGRLFWMIGLAVGIFAGGVVAMALSSRISPPSIGGN